MPQPPDWAAGAIIRAGRRMDAQGWVPATAGNISLRVAPGRIAITASGVHKGMLTHRDVMLVDAAGAAITPGLRPSAETGLHCQLYALLPETEAVLHGHSVAATVLSQVTDTIELEGYELLKAFGAPTHEVRLTVPVVANDQDIPRLAAAIAPALERGAPAYVIRGHGTYVWGRTMNEAMARLEALEFLLACTLERRRIA
jgi:methylthioribulose-1-phosphate dehydratase